MPDIHGVQVFGIVAAQLICTILVTAFVMSNPGLKLMLQQSYNDVDIMLPSLASLATSTSHRYHSAVSRGLHHAA